MVVLCIMYFLYMSYIYIYMFFLNEKISPNFGAFHIRQWIHKTRLEGASPTSSCRRRSELLSQQRQMVPSHPKNRFVGRRMVPSSVVGEMMVC